MSAIPTGSRDALAAAVSDAAKSIYDEPSSTGKAPVTPVGDAASPIKDEDYVLWAYRLLLGREPESADIVTLNPFKNDRESLVQSILDSDEYQTRKKTPSQDLADYPYLSWNNDAVAFIHIVKTGGTTLHTLLGACFSKDRVCPLRNNSLHLTTASELARHDFFSGHFDYFALRWVPRQRVRCISLFRDPCKRLISAYRYARSHPPRDEFANSTDIMLANELNAEEFFEHESIRKNHWYNNTYLFCFGLSFADYETLDVLANGHVPLDVSASNGGPAVVGAVEEINIASEIVERAVRRVRKLDAIGLTERFQDSVTAIFASLKFPVPQSIIPAMVTDELWKLDKRFSCVPPVTMTPRLSRALERLTRYDRIIYDVAKREFEHRRAHLSFQVRDGNPRELDA